MPKTLLALFAVSAVVAAAATAAPAARLAGCALVTTRDAQLALGGLFRISLVQQAKINVRECSIRVVRTKPEGIEPYIIVRDWPDGGGKRAFDFTVKTLRPRKQPKGIRFVSFTPLKGLGAKAYTSELLIKGHPRRSVLVWTGSNFVHVFNAVASVTLPQLVGLARDAVPRS